MRKATLRYFRARTGNGSAAIENMMRAAIGTVGQRWKDREWINRDYDPPKVLLANHLRPSKHNIFGDLLAMHPEAVDLVIDTSDENAREATTQKLAISNANSLIRSSLFWLMEQRYGRGATLITSQIPVDRWHDVIGEPTIADAILDRIVHNAHRIKLKGDSLRRKLASQHSAA
jgi:hypothetical protein